MRQMFTTAVWVIPWKDKSGGIDLREGGKRTADPKRPDFAAGIFHAGNPFHDLKNAHRLYR